MFPSHDLPLLKAYVHLNGTQIGVIAKSMIGKEEYYYDETSDNSKSVFKFNSESKLLHGTKHGFQSVEDVKKFIEELYK